VHVDALRRHESVVEHEPDAVVAGRAPHPRVCRHGDAELAGDLERAQFREERVAGHVEGELEAEHVVAGDPAAHEVAELRRGGPLRRWLLDVAVGEHEAAGHGLQRVDGGVGVLHGLQAVRPVHDSGHAGVEGLDRGQQVARVHVLGAEEPPGLQVIPDEVLGQRPVRAVAAHRGLPHVPVRVDHAGHDDSVGRVDHDRAVRRVQTGPDGHDAVPGDQDVGAREHVVPVVHREYRAAAQQDRPARREFGSVSHGVLLVVGESGWS